MMGSGRVGAVRPSAPRTMVVTAVARAEKALAAAQQARELHTTSLGSTSAPLVIDADGLNLIAEDPALGRQCARRSAPTVITPHPGEASRLLECSADQVQASRDQAVQDLAKRFNTIAVLKGAGTVICDAAGNTQINTTGNAALATGGTGDVLAGFMAALIAQGLEPLTAARESVRIHGLAAEQLTDQIGGVLGITASELIPVIRKLLNSSERF